MTHIPSKSELRTLMEPQSGPCISLFLPTGRAEVAAQQNPLRLGYLFREADSHLLLNNLHASQIETLLQQIQALLDSESFWLHPQDGLVIFRSPS